jgi:hypothetical protein
LHQGKKYNKKGCYHWRKCSAIAGQLDL